MNWLPSFMTPMFGAIAAAIAIPALLILYFLKLRRREVAVSSTLLWRKAVQDLQVNSPFQRLRRNLLLLLQLMLLALLCLALSRPVINTKRGAGKLTVLLIDRSASMGAKDVDAGKRTRLDEAKRRALEIIDSMKRDDTACLIGFDDSAETLCPLTSDTARLRAAINAVQQTDRKSRLKLGYQLAEAQASFIPEQNRANVKPDVFLLSDGRALDSKQLNLRGNLIFEKIGKDDTPNVAIVALSAKRNYERPAEVQVFARLANFGPMPVEADVNMLVATEFKPEPAWQISKSAKTWLYPERWDTKKRDEYEKAGNPPARDSVEFKLELTSAAVVKLEQMNKKADALAADDVAQVVVPAPKAQSILLVTDGNYYFEQLKTAIQNARAFDILHPASYEEKKPEIYDVVIFDRYAPKFVPKAGNFMFFRDVPDGLKVKAMKDGARPLWTQDNYVLDWKRDHAMLRGLSLGKIYAKDARRLETALGVERLVEGTKGPLVVLSREGRSTHLICAFDPIESNWPLRMSFPIFMYNAVQYLALGAEMEAREAVAPGVTPTIPVGELKAVTSAQGLKSLKVSGPPDDKPRTVPIPATGDFVLPAMDHVGLYWLDVPVPGYERFAVNLLDSNESDLRPSDQAPGGNAETVISTTKQRTELWWWLALIALPLLMIEWWVYTRRVHL